MRSSFFAIFVWLFASPVMAGEIPNVLYRVEDPGGPPGWISQQELNRAMEESGKPPGSRLEAVSRRLFLHPERLASSLEDYGKAKSFRLTSDGEIAECEPQFISYHYDPRAKDLQELVAVSNAVLSIRIVASKPGFRSGQAGELLEAEVIEVLKETDELTPPADFLYLFDRYARMVVDGRSICLGHFQIPHGEYLLFLHWDPKRNLGIPSTYLDNTALIALDGTFFGSLLDDTVQPSDLKLQLGDLERFLASR